MKKFFVLLGLIIFSVLVFVGIFFAFQVNRIEVKNNQENSIANSANQLNKKILESKRSEDKYSTLAFVGDIMLSRGVGNKMQKEHNYKWPFLLIADYLKKYDLLFGNLEGAVSDKGRDRGKKYSFRADIRSMQGLSFAGFNVLSIANNHIFDWGKPAMLDCVSRLKQNNIEPVGHNYNPIITIQDGTKIGFLAYSYSDTIDTAQVAKDIASIKPKSDIVVVSFHWGQEYHTKSNKFQQDIAHLTIDAGADLIIGSHPHVVQEVEVYKGVPIFYSLGNFIFDQTWSEQTMRGAIAQVIIKNKKIQSHRLVLTQISKHLQVDLRYKTQANNLINKASIYDNTSNRIAYISEQFLGTPYKANTLVGSSTKQEELVINMDALDCFTFVDYVLALSVSKNADDFAQNLKHIRYKNGEVDFKKRNHFFSQWINNNSNYIFNPNNELSAGICQNKTLDYINGIDPLENKICYLPATLFQENTGYDLIFNGDIIGFITSKDGLDVSHLGIIDEQNNIDYIIHASSVKRKVVKQKLKDYIQAKKNFLGLLVARAK